MTANFASYSASLLFNYLWPPVHPQIRPFLADNMPFLLDDHPQYTAYGGPVYQADEIQQVTRSVSFNQHPFFNSHYTRVIFSALLNMVNDKCIGHYAAQVCFEYTDHEAVQLAVQELRQIYLAFPGTEIKEREHGLVEITTTDDIIPATVFLHPQETMLIVGVTPFLL